MDPVTILSLATKAIEKAAEEAGSATVKRFLPPSNDTLVAAELNDQTRSAIYDVQQWQRRFPEFAANIVAAELNAALGPIREQLHDLQRIGRLDQDMPRAATLELLQAFSEQFRKAYGDARREALANALVRQFDIAAGDRGVRNVWWVRLCELHDYEVDVLTLLGRGSVVYDNSGVFYQHSSWEPVSPNRSDMRRLTLEEEPTRNLLSSLRNTVRSHGNHFGEGSYRTTDLLASRSESARTLFHILDEGRSLLRFAARLKLGDGK